MSVDCCLQLLLAVLLCLVLCGAARPLVRVLATCQMSLTDCFGALRLA